MRYRFTFLVTHSTMWWLGCFIYLAFHIVCSICLSMHSAQHDFRFNFKASFSQPVPCFFFIRCCSLYHYILLFLHIIPSCFLPSLYIHLNSYPSKIIKTYPSSYFPAKIYPINRSLLGSSAPCIVINFLVLINHFYFHSLLFFNSFVPNASFLNPLKTSENLTVFWCFQAVEKGCIGNKWVNINNKQQQT